MSKSFIINKSMTKSVMITLLMLISGLELHSQSGTIGSGNSTVINGQGRPLGGINVAVCTHPAAGGYPCNNLATVYTDSTFTTVLTGNNPTTTDSQGNWGFYVNQIVDVEFYGPGVVSKTIVYPIPASKALIGDAVQYVSVNNGNDSNDGLSPGSAKLTIGAAVTALNAPITGGGKVYVAAGAYAGGITLPSGVAIIGSGKQSTKITAPSGGAAFDFPNGIGFSRLEDMWISITDATSTGITMEGNASLNKFTQFNTIRNVRIVGDRTVGEHGINAQGTASIGDVSLNKFDSVEVANIDIPIICHFCEGDTWDDTQIVEYNEANAGSAIAFDATGAYNERVQLRVTADNLTGTGDSAYFNSGQRNQVQVYCESANAMNQACVKDVGLQNQYLVTAGTNSTPGTSLTSKSGLITNSATVPFLLDFPTGLVGGSPILELADASGTIHAYFDNNGIYNWLDPVGHLGILGIPSLTANPTNWLLPNAQGTFSVLPSSTLAVGFTSPNIVAEVNLTGQQASTGPGTLYTVPVSGAGLYRVSCYAVVTQAATVSSSLPYCALSFQDSDTNTSTTAAQFTFLNSSNVVGANSTNQTGAGALEFNAKASSNILYSTVNYASSGATPMQYAVHFRLEYLGP